MQGLGAGISEGVGLASGFMKRLCYSLAGDECSAEGDNAEGSTGIRSANAHEPL